MRSQASHQATLGNALAVTTGVRLEPPRLQLVLIGVGCTATATVTAVAGPIAFIAPAAPQIGRRLTRAPGVPLLPATLTGAVLLPVAQMALAPVALTLRYGDRVVSTRLSLDVPDGAFTAVVGPNACGKSTLLRAFVRLLRPAEGEVRLDDRVVGSYPAKVLARSLGFLPQDPIAPRVVVGVTDLADRPVPELSGGQLLTLLARLRDEGRTVIAVLHDINQACRYADHLVAMTDGAIVAEGAPRTSSTPH